MQVNGREYRTIWLDENDSTIVRVIDQERLPFFFETKELRSVEDAWTAINDMTVRGAPLIGAAAAFGMYLSTLEINNHTNIRDHLANAARYLKSARPTAVNLSWAVDHVLGSISAGDSPEVLTERALQAALGICETESENCRRIGEHGVSIIEEISSRKNGENVNILTHCNAGWLACIDYGTALAPVYLAKEKGIPVHVWVDETRPKNQGARLTVWELEGQGIPCTLVTDNAGGHLMQKGMVDLVLVGCDRATAKGDIANKIGTYLKALAAYDNKVPFYVAMPSSSVDMTIGNGLEEIIIEEREAEEVTTVTGLSEGTIAKVSVSLPGVSAGNWGFDITPARLITGFITERGICRAGEKEIRKLFGTK